MSALLVVGLIALTLGGSIMAASSRPRWLVALYTACATAGLVALIVVLATAF